MNEEMSIVLKSLRRAFERLERFPPENKRDAAIILEEPARLIDVMLPKWKVLAAEMVPPEDARSYARAAQRLVASMEQRERSGAGPPKLDSHRSDPRHVRRRAQRGERAAAPVARGAAAQQASRRSAEPVTGNHGDEQRDRRRPSGRHLGQTVCTHM